GGEYAAINSAIDELIPARNRGHTDLAINGSYWIGAALGSLVAVLLLNEDLLSADLGWRLAFGLGGLLGLGIMLVRRHVPESPRWLFIHGKEAEAERIVDRIEDEVRRETQRELPEPGEAVTVRQRDVIPFREIAGVAVRRYPRRAVLGLALFVGQAILHNAIVFDLGTLLNGFFDIGSGSVPYFLALFAIANFLGPLLLGRLFDTVGRKPMIAGTYFGSAVAAAVLAVLLVNGSLAAWGVFLPVSPSFFVASAGACAANLAVSGGLAMAPPPVSISPFSAVDTVEGAITRTALCGHLAHSGDALRVAFEFLVGAAAITLAGVAE